MKQINQQFRRSGLTPDEIRRAQRAGIEWRPLLRPHAIQRQVERVRMALARSSAQSREVVVRRAMLREAEAQAEAANADAVYRDWVRCAPGSAAEARRLIDARARAKRALKGARYWARAMWPGCYVPLAPPASLSRRLQWWVRVLPPSAADAEAADAWGRQQWPRKRRWAPVEGTAHASSPVIGEGIGTEYRHHRPTMDARVSMPSRILSGHRNRAVVTVWDFTAQRLVRRVVKAPRGYTLAIDAEGVRIQRNGHHCHLDSDIARPGGMLRAAANLRELIAVRKCAAAKTLDNVPRRLRTAKVRLADARASSPMSSRGKRANENS